MHAKKSVESILHKFRLIELVPKVKLPGKFRVFLQVVQNTPRIFQTLADKNLCDFCPNKFLFTSGSFSEFEKDRLLSYDVLACIK